MRSSDIKVGCRTTPTSDVTCFIVAFLPTQNKNFFCRCCCNAEKSKKYSKNSASKNSFPNKFHFDTRKRAKLPTRFCDTWLKRISNYAYLSLPCMPFFFVCMYNLVTLYKCAIYVDVPAAIKTSIKEFSETKWVRDGAGKCNKNISVFNVVVLYGLC